MHRRENWGEPIRAVCATVRQLSDRFPGLHVVHATHPNPDVVRQVAAALGQHPRILIAPPVDYGDFALLRKASVVLTDSGGIQEEAPSPGRPGTRGTTGERAHGRGPCRLRQNRWHRSHRNRQRRRGHPGEHRTAAAAAGVEPLRGWERGGQDRRHDRAVSQLERGCTGRESGDPFGRFVATALRLNSRRRCRLSRRRPLRLGSKDKAVRKHHGARSAPVSERRMGGTGLEPVTPSLSSWCSPN